MPAIFKGLYIFACIRFSRQIGFMAGFVLNCEVG